MRALIGFIILATIVNGVAIADHAELRCQPVMVPTPKPCSWELYRELGRVPNRCRDA